MRMRKAIVRYVFFFLFCLLLLPVLAAADTPDRPPVCPLSGEEMPLVLSAREGMLSIERAGETVCSWPLPEEIPSVEFLYIEDQLVLRVTAPGEGVQEDFELLLYMDAEEAKAWCLSGAFGEVYVNRNVDLEGFTLSTAENSTIERMDIYPPMDVLVAGEMTYLAISPKASFTPILSPRSVSALSQGTVENAALTALYQQYREDASFVSLEPSSIEVMDALFPEPGTEAPCGIAGHELGNGREHTLAPCGMHHQCEWPAGENAHARLHVECEDPEHRVYACGVCGKASDHAGAPCGNEGHYRCDGTDHGEDERASSAVQCGHILYVCDADSIEDHRLLSDALPCDAAGLGHQVYACTSEEEIAGHREADCGADGHFACDGQPHRAFHPWEVENDKVCNNPAHCDGTGGDLHRQTCGQPGHYNCDGGDHRSTAGAQDTCGQAWGHYLCDGRDHSALDECGMEGHYACAYAWEDPDTNPHRLYHACHLHSQCVGSPEEHVWLDCGAHTRCMVDDLEPHSTQSRTVCPDCGYASYACLVETHDCCPETGGGWLPRFVRILKEQLNQGPVMEDATPDLPPAESPAGEEPVEAGPEPGEAVPLPWTGPERREVMESLTLLFLIGVPAMLP